MTYFDPTKRCCCNILLGMAKDNPATLAFAIDYLLVAGKE